MAKTTFEEEIYLRNLTGRLVGKVLDDIGVNKVAVVVPDNKICISMGSSTLSAFLSLSGGTGRIFVASDETVADRIAEYDPQVIVFQFGGEWGREENIELLKKIVNKLEEKEVASDVVFHVRTFAMGALDELSESDFLYDRDVYVYTVDLEKGKVYLNKWEGKELIKVLEYDVSFEHADLLNRSLKDRTVTFKEL